MANIESTPKRVVIGISGASGTIYGVRILQRLRTLGVETHLIVSHAGELTRNYELDLSSDELKALADVVYRVGDFAAPIASGSFRTIGMIIAPCSMRTLAEIASGVTTTLLTRAADVVLKERRRLVLLPRETPLHGGHLKNMLAVTEMGGIIMPPVPAFYHRPKTIEEIVDDTVCRSLELLGIEVPETKRWGEG